MTHILNPQTKIPNLFQRTALGPIRDGKQKHIHLHEPNKHAHNPCMEGTPRVTMQVAQSRRAAVGQTQCRRPSILQRIVEMSRVLHDGTLPLQTTSAEQHALHARAVHESEHNGFKARLRAGLDLGQGEPSSILGRGRKGTGSCS